MDKKGDRTLTFVASLWAKQVLTQILELKVSSPFPVSTVFAPRQMHPDNFEIRPCGVPQADGENTIEGTGC